MTDDETAAELYRLRLIERMRERYPNAPYSEARGFDLSAEVGTACCCGRIDCDGTGPWPDRQRQP